VVQELEKFKNSTLKVGLFGGSFNPVHEGHLLLSNRIQNLLELDFVWWLVTPCNPMKKTSEMMQLNQRITLAKEFTKNHYNICVTSLEKEFNSYYTIDMVQKLKTMFPKINFVWMMGADNLAIFHKWNRWQDLFNLIPIAVYDRPSYAYAANFSKAAIFYKNFRHQLKDFDISNTNCPNWCYIRGEIINYISSTKIREQMRYK